MDGQGLIKSVWSRISDLPASPCPSCTGACATQARNSSFRGKEAVKSTMFPSIVFCGRIRYGGLFGVSGND